MAPDSLTAVQLLVASAGNEVMLDIASLLADGLAAHGVPHEILIDEMPAASAGALPLVVAPHEFFPLFADARDGRGAEALLARAHVLNVEQPGSQWFEIAWHYARRSAGVFDISAEGCREFARRGRPAVHLPVGYAPRLASAVPLDGDRAIDVLFLGHLSPRREEFFARHAAAFAGRRCHLVFADVAAPRTAATAGYYAGRARRDLFAASRIVLNVHSGERSYFETHRAMLALANRCLLVSEASRGTAPLVSGEHFVMDALDELPARCLHYLDHPVELCRIASRGHELVTTRWRAADTCRPLLDAIARPAAAPVVVLPSAAAQADADEAARRAVIGRIAEARARRERGDPGRTVEENAACADHPAPSVTVVVTLYNYAAYIGECLDSVVASDPVPGGVEIVVVDDASTDDSARVVEQTMAASRTPMRLVRKALNTGLAEARNAGLELARGRAVFVLDADNWIYPSCLPLLFDALSRSGSAAAYPIIRTFLDGTNEPLGLVSEREWDVRSLVRGPYIDAMAMFDREALVSVGGYSTELIDHGWFGWEDYDLWLKLARAGRRCEIVPAVLASYRVHPASMIHRTNRSSQRIAGHLRHKFRDLAGRHPGMDRYFGFPVSEGAPAPAPPPGSADDVYRHSQELHRQLADVHASMSWRVTRPLRWIYGALRGR